jgi:hypothetical protein
LGKFVVVKEIIPSVPPQVVGLVTVPAISVGPGFTATLPVIFTELQPSAFFTVKVKGIEVPEAGALKLTVMGLFGRVASVTVVKPVPAIEYFMGVRVLPV